MKREEIKLHLDTIIGEDSEKLNDIGFMIAMCKVYNVIRPVLIFIKPFLKLKRALALGAEAFIFLMDSRCKVNNDE